MNMEQVITIEAAAYFKLLEESLTLVRKIGADHDDKYVNADRAKELLGILSNNHLKSLRDQGCIEFSNPSKKIILYNKESLIAYLDKHAKKAFR